MGTASEAVARDNALGDSRVLRLVFQPLFWYMRLSGFLVPMICDCRLEPSATTHRRHHSSDMSLNRGTPPNRLNLDDAELSSLTTRPRDNAREFTSKRRKPMGPGERRSWLRKAREFGECCLWLRSKRSGSPSPGPASAATKRVTPGNDQKKRVEQPGSEFDKYSGTKDLQGRAEKRLEEQDRSARTCGSRKPEVQGRQDSSSHAETCVRIPEIQNDVSSVSQSREKKQREERRPRRCSKCRTVSLCTRFLCGFVCLLLAFNAARYISVFYTTGSFSAYLISAVIFQSFFVAITCTYVFSAYDIAKTLPQIMEDLLKFEMTYGTAVDCAKFNRRNVRRCGFMYALQATFSLGMVLLEQSVFPSLRNHLAPFHKTEGVVLYCTLAGYSVLLFFIGSILYSLLGFMAVMTAFLTREFSALSGELRNLLIPTDHAVRGRPSRRNPEESASSCSSVKKSPEKRASFSRKTQTNLSKSKDEAPCTIVIIDDIIDDLDGVFDDSYACGVTEGNAETVETSRISKDHRASERGRNGRNCLDREEKPDSRGQRRCVRGKLRSTNAHVASEEERSPSTSASGLIGVLRERQTHGDEDSSLSQEAAFDVLRVKHQALCDLVTITSKCVRHFVGIGYAGSIPFVCLIIFSLTSGSLDLANILFQVYNIIFSALYLTLLTIFGICVNSSVRLFVCFVGFGVGWGTLCVCVCLCVCACV